MPRRAPIHIAAPVADVRAAAIERLGAPVGADGSVRITDESAAAFDIGLRLTFTDHHGGTAVAVERVGELDLAFFAWFFRPILTLAAGRTQKYAIATLRHACEGAPEPAPPKPVIGLPPVPFTAEQAALLATASVAVAVVGFGSSLFGQFADPIQEAFGASDARLSFALGFTRVGAIVAVFLTAYADRAGRRRTILFGVAGCAIAAAISAAAPTFEVFMGAQVLQRACLFVTGIVAGIAAIEEAPEGARAYAASMLALAGGLGFSFTVVMLPLADLGAEAWRIPYAFGALSIVLLPSISSRLTETTRFVGLAARTEIRRGQLRELFDPRYGRRFLLLASIGLLTNVFNAPSSQLMNKYLTDERGFSNTGVAGFRTVTTAIPGLVGLIVGGRLAERYGRRPVAITALLIATSTQMVFFLYGGPVLWVMSAVSVLTSAAAGIALGTLDAELFPTELRGTSNGLLTIVNVCGSFAGLMLAAELPFEGVGKAIALLGIPTLLAAVFLVPRLPETSARLLDDVSPSEPADEYRPQHE